MNTEQKTRLDSFLRQTEGSPPPVFVGRTGVLEDLVLATDQVWQGTGTGEHGAAKSTRIIHGAPGAGKSSILSEILSMSLAPACGNSGSRVVLANSSLLEENISIVLDLLFEAGRTRQGEWTETARNFWTKGRQNIRSVRVAGADLDVTPQNIEGIGALARKMPGEKWQRPILLAIDEAQNLSPDRNSPHGLVLRAIHDGDTGLPITLVLAGLGDTRSRIADMGLTRISPTQQHSIGPLSAEETAEFMSSSCTYFGIDVPDGVAQEIDRLVRICDGWPRHLHHSLQALGIEALKAGGNLGEADWGNIHTEAASRRDGYYMDQYSDKMRDAKNMTIKVMAELERNPSRSGIKKLMKELHSSDADTYCFPPSMNADSFFDHLLHQGALQDEGDDCFACPIPSFRTYLLNQA
ncbi:MAG: ATP-binding protein [Gammaproteobacteria bacterium]|nr:ATP-binding protein [Gammaproteobacteria bacterium]